VDVVGIEGGSLLVLMLEALHSLHTHSRRGLFNKMQFSTCYSGYKMYYLISKWRHSLFNNNYLVVNVND
jgi:hypothetical protein